MVLMQCELDCIRKIIWLTTIRTPTIVITHRYQSRPALAIFFAWAGVVLFDGCVVPCGIVSFDECVIGLVVGLVVDSLVDCAPTPNC